MHIHHQLTTAGESWNTRINSICLTNPLHFTHLELNTVDDANNDTDAAPASPSASSFASFIATRCRAYVLSEEPLGIPVPGAADHGCNCFSSGEALNIEGIFPRACEAMLAWLNMVYQEPDFCEAGFEVLEIDGEEGSGSGGGVEVEQK